VKSVERKLKLKIYGNHYETGHAQCKSGDIDERIPFVPGYVPPGGFHIVFKHAVSPKYTLKDFAFST